MLQQRGYWCSVVTAHCPHQLAQPGHAVSQPPPSHMASLLPGFPSTLYDCSVRTNSGSFHQLWCCHLFLPFSLFFILTLCPGKRQHETEGVPNDAPPLYGGTKSEPPKGGQGVCPGLCACVVLHGPSCLSQSGTQPCSGPHSTLVPKLVSLEPFFSYFTWQVRFGDLTKNLRH